MTKHRTGAKQSRNQRHWLSHVKALKKSGLSRAEYCRQHKLSYHALTYWQRKMPRSTETTLVPVPLERVLKTPGQSKSSGLKIYLTDRISIEVSDHFSSATLQRVLSVLESR